MGLGEKTKPIFNMCTWKWWREWNQVGKHSSGYYPGELPQPNKTGQHSNSGNTENTIKILLEKSNPKTHICSDSLRLKWRKKMVRAAREKGRVTHKGKPIRCTADVYAETLQPEESGGQFSTFLKKRIFSIQNFISSQSKLHKWRRNKILYRQACLTRSPEWSTKHGKEQPVPATAKTNQIVKTIDTMKKLHRLMGKTIS